MICSPTDLPLSRLPGMSTTAAVGGSWSKFPGAEALLSAVGGNLVLYNGRWFFALDPELHYALSLKLKRRLPPMYPASPFRPCSEHATGRLGEFAHPLTGCRCVPESVPDELAKARASSKRRASLVP